MKGTESAHESVLVALTQPEPKRAVLLHLLCDHKGGLDHPVLCLLVR